MTLTSGTYKSVTPNQDQGENADEGLLDAEQCTQADDLFDIVAPLSNTAHSTSNNIVAPDAALLATLDDSTSYVASEDPIHLPPADFVAFFAKINVILNASVAELSEANFQAVASQYIAVGNSRAAPSRFLYACPNHGCNFTHTIPRKLALHVSGCKISISNPPKPRDIPCRKDGCDKMFATIDQCHAHERDTHNFQPRKCHLGCGNGKIYSNIGSWRRHMETHDELWDETMICRVPECERKLGGFPTREKYVRHLRDTHHLRGEEQKKYLPAKQSGFKRPCPFPDCERAAPGMDFTRRSDLEKHLMIKKDGHKLAKEEAMDKIDQMLLDI